MDSKQKIVAKLVMVDQDDKYLLMYRSDHPHFGVDPDLPGGTQEEGESALETMLREVKEEAGIVIDQEGTQELYSGTTYSAHGTHYALYGARLAERPEVVMSWEHSAYEWLPQDEFIDKAMSANDTFMHMVGEVVSGATIA